MFAEFERALYLVLILLQSAFHVYLRYNITKLKSSLFEEF